ncbi:MAG: hypothetical protein IPF98_20025 [Gemmatimonadetes bacterium]|nr:hypothetical protein [Gemmatimonadota bacterium]
MNLRRAHLESLPRPERPSCVTGRAVLVVAALMAAALVVTALSACVGSRNARTDLPAASFLVSAGDSTFWVESDSAGLRVRRSPMLLTEHGGRFYELYLTDVDLSYIDAVILGQRVWRRDVATGDSLLLLDDSVLVALAADYAARHPNDLPLAPDEEAAEEPSTHATTDTELLDVAGPFLMIEQHVDIDVLGERDQHVTRRGVLDARDGHAVSLDELIGKQKAGDVFREGNRLLAAAIDSIRRTSDERARRAATALAGFTFDSLSFSLVEVDGAPAVAFVVPGRGPRAGGYALPLPPISIEAGSWWDAVRDGIPVATDSGGRALVWRGTGYDVVAREDSTGESAALALRREHSEWTVARVPVPVRRVHRLDLPGAAATMVPALRRAFDEAALYSGEVRTASRRSQRTSTVRWVSGSRDRRVS